jgi:hypothetical protein
LLPEYLKQAGIVGAIVYLQHRHADQMLPGKPLPHPELEEKKNERCRM